MTLLRAALVVAALFGTAANAVPQPNVTIDPPKAGSDPLVISGYAYDSRATTGIGIGDVEIWAYSVDLPTGMFIGSAILGSDRSTKAADLNLPERFDQMGYEVTFPPDLLAPGEYELRAMARSTEDGGIATATVSVTIPEPEKPPAGRDPLSDASGMPRCDAPASAVSGTRWRAQGLTVSNTHLLYTFIVICNTSDRYGYALLEATNEDNRSMGRRAYGLPPHTRYEISLGSEIANFYPGGVVPYQPGQISIFNPATGRPMSVEITSQPTVDGTARIIVETAMGFSFPNPIGGNTPATCVSECARVGQR